MSLLLKLLGLVDLLSGIALFLDTLELLAARIAIYLGILLVAKGTAFFGSAVSKFDVLLGLYLMLTILTDFHYLNFVIATYLVLKGLYSMF